LFPGNGARKELDCWDDGARKEVVPSWMSSPLGTPRGRYDKYSSKIFPQLRNQGLSFLERRDKRLKVMLASLRWLRTIYIWHLVQALLASCNAEPAHTQPSTLFPTYDEVVNLTGLLETKVMSVSSGKQWKYASKVNSASKVNRWW
jgi:hypothetical protein